MALREADCVNPACAGMIRRARPVCRWAICKPRVCGDDPYEPDMVSVALG